MTTVVQSAGGSNKGGRERVGVLAVAGAVVMLVVAYLALSAGNTDSRRGLLPYQTLASTLPESDQQQFKALRQKLLDAEAERSRVSRWPSAESLGLPGAGYRWTRFDRGVVTNYFGQPTDASQPAWLLEIQEPEPGTAADPAPNDEEHHRLADGTTLHVYVWTHRFGGQLRAEFVAAPQNTGWAEVFAEVPNPVFAIKR
ncbi:MAG TPA: hypothetical protein VGG73_00840 [Vicinamibacterales bacterium]|jgi:hypothetical protein